MLPSTVALLMRAFSFHRPDMGHGFCCRSCATNGVVESAFPGDKKAFSHVSTDEVVVRVGEVEPAFSCSHFLLAVGIAVFAGNHLLAELAYIPVTPFGILIYHTRLPCLYH